MGRYLLTPSAKEDIREIVHFIRKDNPNAAIKVKGKFLAEIRRLADFPEMGHFRPEIADQSLRVWSVYSYFIIYRPERKPLEVLRVVHGARNLQRFIFGS